MAPWIEATANGPSVPHFRASITTSQLLTGDPGKRACDRLRAHRGTRATHRARGTCRAIEHGEDPPFAGITGPR